MDKFFRVTYSYTYPTRAIHLPSENERKDQVIYILSLSRPKLADLQKTIERDKNTEPGAHDFLVLSWNEVGQDEININDNIVVWDDEETEVI
jgi:hypothetical protein